METLDKIIEQAISESVWTPATVQDEPETILRPWKAVRCTFPSGIVSTHFMGYAGYEGRVCSAIQTFDKETRRALTGSGRVYQLEGEPGENGDAAWVFERWCHRNHIQAVVDVSSEFMGS